MTPQEWNDLVVEVDAALDDADAYSHGIEAVDAALRAYFKVIGVDPGFVTDLVNAARDELVWLWAGMTLARHDAVDGCWSMNCETLADRIARLSKLVGPTHWAEVDVAILLDGTYERVYQDAGIEHHSVDWDQVNEVQRRITRGAS